MNSYCMRNAGQGVGLGRIVGTVLVSLGLLCGTASAEEQSAPGASGNKLRFNMAIMPASLGYHPQWQYPMSPGSTQMDTSGPLSYNPYVAVGMDLDRGTSGFGADVSFGYTTASGMVPIQGVDLSYILPHKEGGSSHFRLKVGVIHSSAHQLNSNNTVTLDPGTGAQVGIGMEIGKTVAFCWELGYRSLTVNATTTAATPLPNSTLDLSGPNLHLGIKINFN